MYKFRFKVAEREKRVESAIQNLQNVKCLTIIIPCFNEEKTIYKVVMSVLAQKSVGQVIIVDDGSTDRSLEILQSIKNSKILLLRSLQNEGKGSAVKNGIRFAEFPIIGIQDADLEYNPKHYEKLIAPIKANKADIVYGTRFNFVDATRVIYFSHYIANKVLTFACNVFTNINLSDMETGHKFFTKDAAQSVKLKEKRFGIEPELTIKFARSGFRFYEVPISYDGRTYKEGKKIKWSDGLSAIRCIFYYGLTFRAFKSKL